MADYPPYMFAYGTIAKVLEKIKNAATPERLTQDYLAETLAVKGGNAKMVIPFLKRIGFLNGDGSPTEIYKAFRNPTISGNAVAQALRHGYKILYDSHESVHSLSDNDLIGLIVQKTGQEKGSTVVRSIFHSFKSLKEFASFDVKDAVPAMPVSNSEPNQESVFNAAKTIGMADSVLGMNLSYTINLNLPATTDIAVFNAIFKSLNENLLKK